MFPGKMKKWLLGLGASFGVFGCSLQPANSSYAWFEQGVRAYAQTVPEFRVETKNISAMAPEVLFGYAWTLFDKGEKEKSVFVYYLGQLRARILLAARESSTPLSNDYFETASRLAGTALLGKQIYLSPLTRYDLYQRNIFAPLGSVINGWVGADPDMWIKQMQAALDYENAHPFALAQVRPAEKLLPDAQVQKVIQEQKAGLTKLIEYVKNNKEQILQERARREAMMNHLQQEK